MLCRIGPLALALTALAAAGADRPLELPVTRDLWVSSVDREADGNNGGATRLKAKSYQEMSLFDVDTAPLKGRVVAAAKLHVKLAGDEPLRRVTVASVAAPWVEGTSTNYTPERGASTFRRRKHPDTAWSVDGGDLCSVTLGLGGSRWRMAEATPKDAQGWQTVAVDPGVVALRVAGLSEGFLLFDDTGTEWTRQGEKFTLRHMPNRYVYSRDQNAASAPWLEVTPGAEDRDPPATPTGLRSDTTGLPAGEANISWATPADRGSAGTVGFLVTAGGKPVEHTAVPLAGPAGARVRWHLRDLGLKPGAEVVVTVRAVDAAGNTGPAASARVRVSAAEPKALPGEPVKPPPPDPQRALPALGKAEIAVIDELDKVDPATGKLIPEQPRGYLASNHLWSAGDRRITLHAARNEFVAFQLLIQGPVGALQPVLDLRGPAEDKVRVSFGRYRNVAAKGGPLPDPIVPLGGPEDTGTPSGTTRQSLHVEVYVPHDTPAGTHTGSLILRDGDATLALAVRLTVWNATLPDSLSFIPEMNCYGLPPNERDYYRLAHLHRTALNRVPYSHNGTVADGCAPGWDGTSFDWSAWDQRFGPLFDGSAFADLPRKGVPVDIFYLPLHENWPTPVEPNYNGNYWADHAFTPAYRASFVEASRRFSEHLGARGWNDTLFHCYFNGKHDYKARGWSRSTSPWLLDEPANFQDFWALRYFASAFHDGVARARGAGNLTAKLAFRADVSRPQWQRDALDGLLDYNVVGSAMRPYRRIVMDRKAEQGQLVIEYGSANPVEESNVQPLGWSLDAWSLGADGVLPWQTIGRGDSWRQGDTLSLFYPPERGQEPVPSVRLKAFRRGQQDVEYLTLWSAASGEPRWAVSRRVREALKLNGERGSSGVAAVEDAGLVRFRNLKPQDAWALRVRLGQALSAAKPKPARQLVTFRTPPRDPSRLAPGEVAGR